MLSSRQRGSRPMGGRFAAFTWMPLAVCLRVLTSIYVIDELLDWPSLPWSLTLLLYVLVKTPILLAMRRQPNAITALA